MVKVRSFGFCVLLILIFIISDNRMLISKLASSCGQLLAKNGASSCDKLLLFKNSANSCDKMVFRLYTGMINYKYLNTSKPK